MGFLKPKFSEFSTKLLVAKVDLLLAPPPLERLKRRSVFELRAEAFEYFKILVLSPDIVTGSSKTSGGKLLK